MKAKSVKNAIKPTHTNEGVRSRGEGALLTNTIVWAGCERDNTHYVIFCNTCLGKVSERIYKFLPLNFGRPNLLLLIRVKHFCWLPKLSTMFDKWEVWGIVPKHLM